MNPSKITLTLILIAAAVPCAAVGHGEARSTSPATIVMQLPAALGAMERPAVEFDHAAHTAALQQEGCEACHVVDERGLTPQLANTVGVDDRDDLMNAYHESCLGCHEQRTASGAVSGPVTCGECHIRRPPGVSQRAALAFDYSLHGRHALAYPDRCETCHHVYDEAKQQLVYEKGAEEACRACHGEQDTETVSSLRNASHRGCVGCHLDRQTGRSESGPVLCIGCHDAEQQRAIEALDEVPRLLRGQPDRLWVDTEGTTGRPVPFDHLGHERSTSACSDCHHATLEACGSCHTLTNAERGGGVTLERSHHTPQAAISCVGCHAAASRTDECAGCHYAIGEASSEAACVTCHSGPAPGASQDVTAPPAERVVQLAPLPPSSDDFPETILIDVLADTYEGAKLPHRKIVERLDRAVRENRVAAVFHATTDRLCAGCHHHTPAGVRPPPCRSCHGAVAHATRDQPGLYVAYHRQCIGCHQQMKLEQQGCVDCHAERESQS